MKVLKGELTLYTPIVSNILMIKLKENATISTIYSPVTKKYDSQKEIYYRNSSF